MDADAQQLAAFLGVPADEAFEEKANTHLRVAAAMVRAYTRGNGFDVFERPEPDVAAVIVSCTARMLSNPQHMRQEAVGPFSQSPGTFNGWTLPELAVLHRHRKRAT